MDGNIPAETIEYVCNLCGEGNVPGIPCVNRQCSKVTNNGHFFVLVWYEPTCVDKAIKPITVGVHPKLSYISPNLSELRAMYKTVTGKLAQSTHTNGIYCMQRILCTISPLHLSLSSSLPSELLLEDKLSECMQLVPSLLEHIPNIVVSLGKDGVFYASQQMNGRFLHHPAAVQQLLPATVLSVTGAGDRCVCSLPPSFLSLFPLSLP